MTQIDTEAASGDHNDLTSRNELEGISWPEPEFASSLVVTCHRLRGKAVGQLTVEELRVLIGQRIGLRCLLPRALALLEEDLFAEGDYFPGDLLASLVRLNDFGELPEAAARLREIARRALATGNADPDLEREIRAFLARGAR